MSSVAALLRPPQRWVGLDWRGARVVILASGQSLTLDQCAAVQAWRFAPTGEQRRVIAINNTYQRAPWADVLFCPDDPWWAVHIDEVRQAFTGQLWTVDIRSAERYGVRRIESEAGAGLSRRPGVIHQGGNSAFMTLNLGVQAGAKRFVLLGVDMHGTHWHGNHGRGLSDPKDYLFRIWIKNLAVLAKDLEQDGIEVLNCSPGTALHCFREVALEKALA